MDQIKFAILLFPVITFAIACKQGHGKIDEKKSYPNQENLVEANRILVKKDAEKITAFIKRSNWEMVETKTGLWYMIYEKGSGALAKEGNIAIVNYKISLIDGTECYNSEDSGPKEFRIGQGGVESGLEEGILLMHEGDNARFIMPPHLAHGLLGDNNKIPARSIILYEVELIKLDEN